MKKLILIILVMLMFNFVSCSKSKESNSTNTDHKIAEIKKENSKSDLKIFRINDIAKPIDGVNITISNFKIEQPKGDRTKDNVADDNGEYMADGSDIVKVSDYNKIVIDVTIENNTDKAISFSYAGWKAKLQDGYNVEQFEYDNVLVNQVASKNKVTGKISKNLKNTINIQELTISYDFLDYNEEWSKDLGLIMTSKMTSDEYKKKYNPINLTWKLKP